MIELKRIIFILQAALSKNSETDFVGNYSEKIKQRNLAER